MQKLLASWQKLEFTFSLAARTSRGVITSKNSYFLKLYYSDQPKIFGIGEASPLEGLSIDYVPDFEKQLAKICQQISEEGLISENLPLELYPSIEFAIETALLDLENGGKRIIAETEFTSGKKNIPINGLIWMNNKKTMLEEAQKKLAEGYKCLKIKIGALEFSEELDLIKEIRKNFSEKDLEIRVDANGAFGDDEAFEKLSILSELQIHSIEQPIKPGQWKKMADLGKKSPIPIALDEELIGIGSTAGKKLLLQAIKPKYLVLKPTLLGGFQASQEWIELAEELKIGWWITSALETNIGLNAISQWVATFSTKMYQGLGTGMLFKNNFVSPLLCQKGFISYSQNKNWDLSLID